MRSCLLHKRHFGDQMRLHRNPKYGAVFFSGNLGLYEVGLVFLGGIESWVLEVDISSFLDEATALVQQC